VKLWLGFAVVWIASPIDLIPEFIPVAGPLDDAIVAALVLRHLLRRTGFKRAVRALAPRSSDAPGDRPRKAGASVQVAGVRPYLDSAHMGGDEPGCPRALSDGDEGAARGA
jgi:hypothetical protein